MTTETEKLSALQKRLKKNETWSPLAFGHLACVAVGRMIKYTGLYIIGKAPPKQRYTIGVATTLLFPGIECLSIPQYRSFMRIAVRAVQFQDGLGTEARRAKWATKVGGEGWSGYWIPFQDQSKKGKSFSKAEGVRSPSDIPLGSGCDIILLAVHGGGFIDGDALMFLAFFKTLMKRVQQKQNVRIGVVSVQYGLSPEHPYPHAINEIVASYRDLVRQYGVNPKQIILAGDSAGGNLCLGVTLKLRDAFSELGSPAGHVLISPWVRSSDPLKSSLFDVVSSIGCEVYNEAYTRNNPKTAMCQYTSPISASTLAGLSPMLIFIGGLEIIRPSTEQFVERAMAVGVDVKIIVVEGRPHNYIMLDYLSTKQDRDEAYRAIGEFVLHAHCKFSQAGEQSLACDDKVGK
ncbi:hypothetical protein BGX26_011499 [Mortierella sp. AD094]|nr:hypothetical protein BGX26_011499 [Mortierella sp. AD094]